MTTKEPLISLAKEKGFISIRSESFYIGTDIVRMEEMEYYLWMCELQKWLREVHNIHVWCVPISLTEYEKYCFYNSVSYVASKEYNSPEEALEASLLSSLDLLTEDNCDGMIDWRETQY